MSCRLKSSDKSDIDKQHIPDTLLAQLLYLKTIPPLGLTGKATVSGIHSVCRYHQVNCSNQAGYEMMHCIRILVERRRRSILRLWQSEATDEDRTLMPDLLRLIL